jgi:hypothetical protein
MLERAKMLNNASAWVYAMRDNKDLQIEIIRKVKDRLFKEGTNDQGKIIGTYSPFTEKLNRIKVAGAHYTLKDTGEFYESIYIGVMNDYFFIDGDGDKGKDNLFEKYGEGIIGLDDTTFDWFGEKIINKYIDYVGRVLHGN